MKLFKLILLAGSAVVAVAASAQAADLPSKKGVTPPAKIDCFASFWTWFDATPKDCPLTAAGFTLYGAVDMGVGWASNAAKLNSAYDKGVQEVISKQSHGSAWQVVPNGLSQSNIGAKWKEQFAPDWFAVGDINFGFDPYTLSFADPPQSLVQNNFRYQYFQSANADSSRAYAFINNKAYGGISNTTLGTLTYGRHTAFSNDNIGAYDPYGGAYAFSLIGNSSTLGGGLGVTELARYTDSIRYFYSDHNVRVGVLSQVGGWDTGNNAQYAIQGDLGFDFYGFSVDGVYEYAKDAVALGTFGVPNPMYGQEVLKATIQNVSSFQVAAKYNWQAFTVYGGYQNERLTDPDNLPTGAQIANFNDGVQAVYGQTTALGGQGLGVKGAFPAPKVTQLVWGGAKYSVLSNVDLVGAYYHVWQNDYLGSAEVFGAKASCGPNASLPAGTPKNTGYTPQGTANSKCAGTEDGISGMVDWRPYKRLDVYAGAMYTQVNGGLANGFFANSNLEPVAGLRLSF